MISDKCCPMAITRCFPTSIYSTELPGSASLNPALETVAIDLSLQDHAGIAWCKRHGYPGYTSYDSIPNLADASPPFAKLARLIEKQAALFARELHWDLRGGKPVIDTFWVNVLPPGGSHSSHLHTNAVLSGTYYVRLPKGSAAVTFEDPRHALKMATPPLKADAPRLEQTYLTLAPKPGTLLLWESWLRHEVPLNRGTSERISLSFNMVIG